jgi:hypothetical protein
MQSLSHTHGLRCFEMLSRYSAMSQIKETCPFLITSEQVSLSSFSLPGGADPGLIAKLMFLDLNLQ